MAFEDLPIIDHHCHSVLRQNPADVLAFRSLFTESRDERLIRDHFPQTVFYRRVIHDLESFYRVSGEEAVVAAVQAAPPLERARKLFSDAGLQTLLVDTGYRPEDLVPVAELGRVIPVRPILRIERAAQEVLARCEQLDDLMALMISAISDAAASGHVALKTVLAYRTGLKIRSHPPSELAKSFDDARRAAEAGRARITSKPLLDTLVWEICRVAAKLGLPVQIHTGFGDADLLLPEADPSWLKPLFEDPHCRETTFVLLHCYPFVKEAAWLCGVYGHVYMDLSLAIPMMAHDAAPALAEALAYAPWSKVLLATDAHSTPELFWVAARAMREALEVALDQIRNRGHLAESDLEPVAAALLAGNARRVYRVDLQ